MLPVHGPGFRGRFWAGFDRKPSANGPKSGPKLLGPKARAVRDQILVRSHLVCCENRPARQRPRKAGPGTGNIIEQPKVF